MKIHLINGRNLLQSYLTEIIQSQMHLMHL
jgi:hypothetical protein